MTLPNVPPDQLFAEAGPTLSVEEAAHVLGISRNHAYELIKRGEWPTKVLRLGRRFRVPTVPLRRYLEIEEG